MPETVLTLDRLPLDLHPILFDVIDGTLIRETALRTEGAVGPSGLDATAWKRLCCFVTSASADLCGALALVARHIFYHMLIHCSAATHC